MKITGLKQQVTNSSRYSVYVDGKFLCGLSADAILGSGLVAGEELDERRLKQLKSLSVIDKAYTATLRYVTIRQRSEWEVALYLQRKGVGSTVAKDIIERLRALGLLDDASFARAWVANRRLLKATNKQRLGQELRQKHVSNTIIDMVLAEDDTDESVVLRDLITKKRQIPRYRDDKLKLMQYLARQGYGYEQVKAAILQADEGG